MPSILVVEDDAAVREILEIAFEDAGYAIVAAATLAEARRELEKGQIGCVFTDLFLQGESGLDIADMARARGIPAVIASGSSARVHELRKAGWQVVAKPFRLAELTEAVEASLAAITREGSVLDAGILDAGILDGATLQRFLATMAQRCRELAALSPAEGLTDRLASLAEEFEGRYA